VRGLTGRVALVTGAGRGIGRAIAERLAAEGMRVVVNDIDASAAAAAAAEIASSGGQAVAAPGDVAKEGDARRMVATCREAFGSLNALINNAGIDVSGPVREIDWDKWSGLHAVDLWAPLLLTREAESLLAADGGVVINIASTHAIATVPERSVYAAAKAGVVGLSRALAIDLGPRGIRVLAVLPGYIETPIWDLWLHKARDPQGLLQRIAERHPVRRYGQPEDVAGVVAFLVSRDASYMTGSAVVVDGGYTSLLESPLDV